VRERRKEEEGGGGWWNEECAEKKRVVRRTLRRWRKGNEQGTRYKKERKEYKELTRERERKRMKGGRRK